MKLHLPFALQRLLVARTTGVAVFAVSSSWAFSSTLSTDVTLDDTSTSSVAVGNVSAGNTYGAVTSGDALTLNGMTLTVNHGSGGTLDSWAGFVMSSAQNTTSFSFNDTILTGDGNLAFAFKSGNAGVHPNMTLSTLNGATFTGRILLLDQWNNGLVANYEGSGLQNAQIVLSKDGASTTIGGSAYPTGTNRYSNDLVLTGSASLSGVSAEPKGTSASDTKAATIQTTGAGTNTLTLTGGCTTNASSVFAGNAGTSSAYFNLDMQGGDQTFSGTNYFGSVAVSNGTLTLGGTTAIKGDVAVSGGTLDLSGASIDAGKTVSLGAGRIDHLTLRVGNTLTQTEGGTLGDLSLSGGTVSFGGLNSAAYSLTGTLTLGQLTTLDFANSAGYGEGTTLFSGVTFGEGFVWDEAEWARYFTLTGTDQDWRIVFDDASQSLKLAANSAAQLTWDNAAGTGAWNTTDANWGDASTTFRTGDAVTFSAASGTITVDADGVVASRVTIDNNSEFVLAGGSLGGPVNVDGGSQVTVNNALSGAVMLAGNSTMNVTGTLDGIVTFSDAGSKLVLTKTDALSSSSTVAGSGIVEVNWGTQSGNVDAQLATFDGTLQISSGRYSAGNTPLAASSIAIADGGQIYIQGGTWNQTFHLAGAGWTSSSDVAKAGSLRLDNGATIAGEVHLTDDTTLNVWTGTGTITSAIDGAGKTLTKVGAGTLKINNAASAIGSLVIQAGTVQMATGNATYGNIGSLVIGENATLQLGNEFGISLTCADITIHGGGTLKMLNGIGGGATIGADSGTIRIDASTDKHAVIAGTWGGPVNVKSLITGQGVFELQQGREGNASYTNPMNLQNAISDGSEGRLSILQTGGTYSLNHTNTYSGGTTLSGGAMTAGANGALGTGDVEIRQGGVLKANNVTLANTIRTRNADNTATQATISAKAGSAGVKYENANLDGTGISSTAPAKATVSHANIDVEQAYSLANTSLVDTLVTLQSGASVTLSNVAIGADSAIANTSGGAAAMTGTSNTVTLGLAGTQMTESLTYMPSGSDASLTFVGVTSSQLNGVAMADGAKLTIDLANDLLCSPSLRGEQYLAVTFEGLTGAGALTSDNFDLSSHLTAGFEGAGVLGVDNTASGGTVVYIGFAPDVMPEPTSSLLTLFGLSGLLLRRRRQG